LALSLVFSLSPSQILAAETSEVGSLAIENVAGKTVKADTPLEPELPGAPENPDMPEPGQPGEPANPGQPGQPANPEPVGPTQPPVM